MTAAYTNYQLPASHYPNNNNGNGNSNGNSNSYSHHHTATTPTTQDPFADQDFFATTPTRLTSSAPPTSTPSNMADIIASQERAMEQARSRTSSGSSSSRALTTTTNTPSSHNPSTSGTPNNNSNSSDAVHPLKKEMKQRRHVKMAAGGVGGAVLGTLVLGPFGTVLGAPIGVYTANKISKKGERRAQRKFEQHNVQQQAMNSSAMQSAAFC
jgi:hypothetical protein